jgi:hypothetical protein
MTPLNFLQLLWQHKPENLYILIWTLHGKGSHWYRELSAAAEFVSAHRTDVYMGVGLARHDHGTKRRCVSEEIAGVAGLSADLDFKSEAHTKNLPFNIEQALTIIPNALPPTVILVTGNGAQAWWLFEEPLIFETEEDREAAAVLISRFQTLLRYNSSQRGWAFDRLSDLARVLRIPGTVNGKDPGCPKEVTVYSSSDRRYNPSEIEEYLDDLTIADCEDEEAEAREWAEQFADKPLVINLSARFSQESLDHWFEADLRFKNTWFRQRQDLNDQSQSGYDMALACFGVSAGLPAQKIVDLIVHHRAMHRQKRATRLDYFQRTISKASKRAEDPDLPGLQSTPASSAVRDENGAGPSAASANADLPEVDPTLAKLRLCDRLSGIFGIRILRLIKISGHDPVFQMDMEQGRVEFPDIGKLISQTWVRNKIAAITGKLIPPFNKKAWQQIAQLLLDACTVHEGGQEMELQGAARMYVRRYLAASTFIVSLEKQNEEFAHRPMIFEGVITVSASDFQLFLAKLTSQSFSIPEVTGMLASLGAMNRRFRGKFPEQSRWLLPSSEFDPANYPEHHSEDLIHDNE